MSPSRDAAKKASANLPTANGRWIVTLRCGPSLKLRSASFTVDPIIANCGWHDDHFGAVCTFLESVAWAQRLLGLRGQRAVGNIPERSQLSDTGEMANTDSIGRMGQPATVATRARPRIFRRCVAFRLRIMKSRLSSPISSERFASQLCACVRATPMSSASFFEPLWRRCLPCAARRLDPGHPGKKFAPRTKSNGAAYPSAGRSPHAPPRRMSLRPRALPSQAGGLGDRGSPLTSRLGLLAGGSYYGLGSAFLRLEALRWRSRRSRSSEGSLAKCGARLRSERGGGPR